MSSYNHRIYILARHPLRPTLERTVDYDIPGGGVRWRPACQGARLCAEKPVYLGRYEYQTRTKGGRSTAQFKLLCEQHGKEFAELYSLELPPAV